ncbi:Telomere-capping, CST complex subunit [Plasmodiophora brassicae]
MANVPEACPVRSGRLVLMSEIGDCRVGDSVRVVARLRSIDPDGAKAVVELDGAELAVDLSLVETQRPILRVPSLLSFLGEMQAGGGLRARVVTCVDGLDLNLYRKAVAVRRHREHAAAPPLLQRNA